MKGEFYKMEFDAWDEGTVDLTLEEEAAYLRLCHQMYRRRGPVPNSDRLLCALWRCHQNKARPLLRRLIDKGKIHITNDGQLTNARVTQEVDARETIGRHRADAGHTGGIRSGDVRRKPLKTNDQLEAKRSREEKIRGEERREEKIECSSSDDAVVEEDPHRDTVPSPSLNKPSPRASLFSDLGEDQTRALRTAGTALMVADGRRREVGAGGSAAGFDGWWAAYPLKKSKQGAQKKYAAIVKKGDTTEAQLLEGARRYAIEKAGSSFIKDPVTWLNHGCWLDEAGPPATQRSHGSRSAAADHLYRKIMQDREQSS